MLDTVLHPVGPEPAAVYWRRRAVALGIPVLVLVVLLLAFSGGGAPVRHPVAVPRASASPTASSLPSATTSASPVASTAALTGTPCTASLLTLGVRTDAAAYPAGVQPRVTVTVAASAACSVDLAALVVEVHSGPDRIWGSNDCRPPASHPVTVTPGAAQTVSELWPRHRSAPATCAAGPAAQAGTYTASATLAGATSTPLAVFGLQ